MKTITKIIVAWACIATIILIYVLILYLDSQGIVEFRRHSGVDYYYPADLKKMNLPTWNLTNQIPLSPDAAYRVAAKFASDKHPGIQSWDVDSILLTKADEEIWVYEFGLIDRQSGKYFDESVRVLPNGTVWKPDMQERPR